MRRADRFFKTDGDLPVEVSREQANFDFVYQYAGPNITRVSYDENGDYTIHCTGWNYWFDTLERIAQMLEKPSEWESL